MQQLFKSYSLLVKVGALVAPLLLLAVRLFWGIEFAQAGWGKFQNMESVISYFQMLGIPAAPFQAHLTATIELVCGCCLAIGVASRLVSLPLIVTMVVAFLTAHRDAVINIWSDPQNFICQLPFNFLLASLIVFCFGPGLFSIDALIKSLITPNDKN